MGILSDVNVQSQYRGLQIANQLHNCCHTCYKYCNGKAKTCRFDFPLAGKRCQNQRHSRSGNKITSLCNLHYKSYRALRSKPQKSSDTAALTIKKLKDATNKRTARQRDKHAVASIENETVRNLAENMADMKSKGLKYKILRNVVKNLAAEDTKREGPKEPINFTDETQNKRFKITRSMQFIYLYL